MIRIDQIIRSRRKTIALIVERDGRVVVRAPLRAREDLIRDLVQQKEAWIRARQEQLKAQADRYTPRKFSPGEEFPYLGGLYPLEIVTASRPALCLEGGFQLAQSALPQARKVFERWYRQRAAQVLSERTAWYAGLHSFAYTQVKITSARTRWGSCSSRGTISYPWRLVMAPLPIIDYIVVHELVHTRVRGHSRLFWDAVRQIVPDYAAHRRWLNQNGQLLSLD